MKSVTYGVTGLIDWNARIPVGKAAMNVHFTGGALTKYGVTPAEFTTTDSFTQRVIEDSEYFRTGRITVLRSVGKADVRPLTPKEGLVAQRAFAGAVLPIADEAPAATPAGEVVVACLEDAIEYLRTNFAVPTHRVRNMAVAQEIGAGHGVKFVFPDSFT